VEKEGRDEALKEFEDLELQTETLARHRAARQLGSTVWTIEAMEAR
jgi:hypothetical protein